MLVKSQSSHLLEKLVKHSKALLPGSMPGKLDYDEPDLSSVSLLVTIW